MRSIVYLSRQETVPLNAGYPFGFFTVWTIIRNTRNLHPGEFENTGFMVFTSLNLTINLNSYPKERFYGFNLDPGDESDD